MNLDLSNPALDLHCSSSEPDASAKARFIRGRTGRSGKSVYANATETAEQRTAGDRACTLRRRYAMIASEIMTTNPECCVPTDPVMKAAQIMKSMDVGPVPVVADQDGRKLTGIVTDRDLAIKVVAEARDPKTTTVEDVMSEGLVTCRDNDDVQSVLALMEDNQLRRIPVVDKKDNLVGIIAQADVATRLGNVQAAGEVVQEVSQ